MYNIPSRSFTGIEMNKNRVAALLASGLQVGQVATIIGVSPGRISQLQKEEDFQLLLKSHEASAEKKDAEDVALSAKYLTAEHALVDQIMSMAPAAELRDAVAALKVVSERQIAIKKASIPVNTGRGDTNNFVVLSLPAHAVQHLVVPTVQITPDREVISVGEQNLTPLGSHAVTALFKQMAIKQLNNLSNPIGGYDDPSSATPAQISSSQEAIPDLTTESNWLDSPEFLKANQMVALNG